MNKEQPVTLTLQELDNTMFQHLTKAMQAQFPNDHRNALKVAMHVADGAMQEFEALAKRQSKSGAAKAAAEARWAGSSADGTMGTVAPTAPAVGSPLPPASTGTTPGEPKRRHRRTKAELAAAAASTMGGVPVPPYTPPAPVEFTPAEQQAAAEFGAAPSLPAGTPLPTPPANLAAAIAAASGSPVDGNIAVPPAPLQIPTFGQS